jgi:hypothetical protein
MNVEVFYLRMNVFHQYHVWPEQQAFQHRFSINLRAAILYSLPSVNKSL